MKSFLITMSLLSFFILSAQDNKAAKHQNLEDKVAIQGYDPVAYFISKPTEGDENISTTHNDAIYYFSSEKNKALFINNPEKYTPEYGGYCAYAIGETGEKVSINPKTYKIVDGKLYLFYNAYFTNTLKSWNKDEERLMEQADKNWSSILN